MPTILYRFFNLYKPKKIDEDKAKLDPFLIILESVSKNKKLQGLKTNIDEIINIYLKNIDNVFLESKNEDIIIKNVSILAYILIKILHKILLIKTDDNDIMKVICSIVNYLIFICVKTLKNNDNNLEILKKSIEQLREKKKQELMNAYAVSEEERELQMMLKKLGLSNWSDTGAEDSQKETKKTQPIIENIIEYGNQKEEDENFDMTKYQGENDDDNYDDDDKDYGLGYDQINE